MTKRGIFIAIEGPDGAGKTTQAHRLAARIGTGNGTDSRLALRTWEPSEGPIGLLIRDYLTGRSKLAPAAIPALFAADRADHAARVIRPALDAGHVVVCDRYALSNIVYRAAEVGGPFYRCLPCGWGGEPGEAIPLGDGGPLSTCPRCLVAPVAFAIEVIDRVEWAMSLDHGLLIPDITVVLSVPPELAVERRRARGGTAELYDGARTQARCCAAYARAGELLAAGEQVAVIDSTGTEDEVADRVWLAVQSKLQA